MKNLLQNHPEALYFHMESLIDEIMARLPDANTLQPILRELLRTGIRAGLTHVYRAEQS